MLCKELVNYQNRLFWVYRKISTESVKQENITPIKEYWGCDIVLKQKTPQGEVFIFLKEIEELAIIE